jgi:hypothetical protein
MEYETLYAMDIVNPFTKTIKVDGLKQLVTRVNDTACYDKVGHEFYKIEESLNKNGLPDTDLVVVWLNHLDGLKFTRETVAFRLDASL